MKALAGLPAWSLAFPAAAVGAVLAGVVGFGTPGVFLAALVLIGAVVAAVHHAEVVAHRVGEPFGTLTLAVAVTVIEVSLIVSLMLGRSAAAATLARDTVFAAVMLILNGIIGLCLLAGGIRHGEQRFVSEGANGALAVLASLATLSLVLPNYTATVPGPVYSPAQLVFVAVVAVALYGIFVLVQTVRHRDYFLPPASAADEEHAAPPTARATSTSFGVLVVALFGVVFLAKALTPALERGVADAGLPLATVGVAIAALVLAPESLAAYRAARRDRLQMCVNLALGSALATIGLTIPAVAIASLLLDLPLALGVDAKGLTLLTLSLFVTGLTLGTGRTTVLGGAVHLVIFATYLFTTVVP